MRAFKYISMVVLISMLFSCEDVVELDLDGDGGDLVIDAWINTRSETQEIRLSLSQSFFSSNTVIVRDAEVVVTNETQEEDYVFEITDTSSTYTFTPELGNNIGDVGDVMSLSVVHRSGRFEAQTTINRVPALDSIEQEFRDDELFGEDGIYTQFFARDPVGQGDAYWIQTFRNGDFLNNANQLNIAFDAGFDAGSRVDGLVFITPIREFTNILEEDGLPSPWDVGDEIRVEIHSISQEAFGFLEIARDQILNGDNGIFTLPQANTRSNITRSNGFEALGFFNVAAVSQLSDVIVEQ